ncbi:MAG: ACP S-malonyltransferase [Lachnospiraceae bacterium]|nr:ACP S-malonyltransferase [Lachnospiraceae bacterium]
MKLAFLYAGQGSQKVGMGKDIYDNNETFKNVIDKVSKVVDIDLKKLMFEGPMEDLSQTKFTQPCMAAFAAGVTKVLKENSIEPEYVAGLSLGEYSALNCAEVFDEETLVKLVAFRGNAMEEAAKGIECKMSAVMGLDSEILDKICEEICNEGNGYVAVSNYNCKGQYVVCGDNEAVSKAEEKAKEAGAKRCMPLKVSGPFHTKYMNPAAEELNKYFADMDFNEMKYPVVFNTTAKELQADENIKDILVKQVANSIYMEKTIEYLEAKGVDTVIEIGPGKALSGFVKRTSDNITAYAVENIEDINKVIEMFGR